MYHEKCKFASLSPMLVIVLILFVSGCATTKPMTSSEQAQTLSLVGESVAIITLRVSNEYKPTYQPFAESITVWKDNGEKFGFTINKPYNEIKFQYNEYLITMSLPPGSYKIGRIYGSSRGINNNPYGTFYIPVFSDFELKQNKVVYLGHIEATVRQRGNDGDLMAGPSIPLLDQVITGALRGTFDIKITDNFDKDIAIFKQKYSSVDNLSVEKTILPPWKKPTGEVIFQYQSLRSEINKPATEWVQIKKIKESEQTTSNVGEKLSHPVQDKKIVTVVWTAATIRSGAGNDYPAVTSVNQGDKLTVIAESGEWFNVQLGNNKQGWISNRVVK